MTYCPKCQAETDRYKSGDCKPCARARSVAYQAANPDKARAIQAKYRAANADSIAAYQMANRDKQKARSAKWYAVNREKVIAKSGAWAKANKDVVNARSAARYKAFPEKVKATNAAWLARNAERKNATNAAWKREHPEAARIQCQNRRASKRNAEGTHTASDIASLMVLQRGKCACCRTSIKDGYHVDHIMPLAKEGGNDRFNLQLLCPTCNLQKSAKHPVDFMQSRGFLL